MYEEICKLLIGHPHYNIIIKLICNLREENLLNHML